MPQMTTRIAMLFPIAVLALIVFLPMLLSRNGLLLGIHVAEDFRTSRQAGELRRQYARRAALVCLLALAAGVYASARNIVWPNLAAIAIEVAGIFALWVSTWSRLHTHRPTQSAVRAAQLAPEQHGMVPWAAGVLAALLPMGAATVTLAVRWQSIPARFPIHWGVNGDPNRWSGRTPMGVFGILIVGAVLVALMAFLGEVIPRISAGFQGSASVLRLTRNVLCACAWMIALLFSATALLPLAKQPTRAVPWMLLGVFGMTGMIVIYVVASARRILPAMAAGQDSTSDSHWLGGMIYFNPNDPAVMVPKRIGVGYTLNMGRPLAWVLLSGILILPLLLSLVLRSHGGR